MGSAALVMANKATLTLDDNDNSIPMTSLPGFLKRPALEATLEFDPDRGNEANEAEALRQDVPVAPDGYLAPFVGNLRPTRSGTSPGLTTLPSVPRGLAFTQNTNITTRVVSCFPSFSFPRAATV